MSLAPGTRIPPASGYFRGFYYGLTVGGMAGLALGLLAGLCLSALAWSHWG